jgi:hypothetical protein
MRMRIGACSLHPAIYKTCSTTFTPLLQRCCFFLPIQHRIPFLQPYSLVPPFPLAVSLTLINEVHSFLGPFCFFLRRSQGCCWSGRPAYCRYAVSSSFYLKIFFFLDLLIRNNVVECEPVQLTFRGGDSFVSLLSFSNFLVTRV